MECLSTDLSEVLFVRLRVISWIACFAAAGAPLNLTKNHENQTNGTGHLKVLSNQRRVT